MGMSSAKVGSHIEEPKQWEPIGLIGLNENVCLWVFGITLDTLLFPQRVVSGFGDRNRKFWSRNLRQRATAAFELTADSQTVKVCRRPLVIR